jgi:hypothetical protein
MMTQMTTRQLMIEEANAKRALASHAHKRGERGLRDSFLRQAADRYRAAGLDGLALYCERFIGQ